MQIQISWHLQKPIDLDLQGLHRQGISGFSRTRVNVYCRNENIQITFFTFSTIFLDSVILVNSLSGSVCETNVTSSSLFCLTPREGGFEASTGVSLFSIVAGGFGLLRLKELPGLLNLNPLNRKESPFMGT